MPSEVTWMNGVVAQFHQDYPAYAKTQVNVKWIPWTNATADWNNALASGKNAPDITELGTTETPTEASLGALANISSFVNDWSAEPDVVSGMLANDTQNGNVYGVPWFGGVRGIWYRTDEFTAAGITSPPTTWAQLVTDAQKLMAKNPGYLRHRRASYLIMLLIVQMLPQQALAIALFLDFRQLSLLDSRGSVDWGGIMAASTLFTIPVMVFFLIVQRRMVNGLVAGAVKG